MATKHSAGYRAAVGGVKRIIGLLLLILTVLLIIGLVRSAFRFGYSIFHQEAVSPPPGDRITVEIPQDATAEEVATILNNAGLIADRNLFLVQERLSPYHGKIVSGRYRLSTAQTADEMLAVLAGDVPDEETEPEEDGDVRDPEAENKLIDDVT